MFDSKDDDVAEMRAQLERIDRGPGIAKASRNALKSKSHAAFCAAFIASGLTISDLAKRLGITRQYAHDMVHGRRDIPDWVMRGLPRESRKALARGWLEAIDSEPPSRVSWG